MSREIYESLLEPGPGADPAEALVRALAHAGQVRKAAHDLATDEMLEGMWVEEIIDESQIRLAADDRSDVERTLSGGPYSVHVQWSPSGAYTVTQTAGPSGATLIIGEQWIPLELNVAADLPVQSMPESLKLMDLQGTRHTLS